MKLLANKLFGKWYKQLKCYHVWEQIDTSYHKFNETGYVYVYICKRCGKLKSFHSE